MALLGFVKRFDIPIPDEAASQGTPYRPAADSPELVYMNERRQLLGGSIPARGTKVPEFKAPALEYYKEWLGGSNNRAVSTTMVFVNILKHLLKDPAIGKLIVPIVPDEGRTFGLESVIRQVGIYASEGQKYTPHDADMLLYYRENQDGRFWKKVLPRLGQWLRSPQPDCLFELRCTDDSLLHVLLDVWLPAHRRYGLGVRGLAGQGIFDGRHCRTDYDARRGVCQHQDGHSIILSSTVPTCITYDPAFAYELAVVIQDGHSAACMRRAKTCFYYLTMYNEDYAMPPMPDGSAEGILRGIYKYKSAAGGAAIAQLFGSGPILKRGANERRRFWRRSTVSRRMYGACRATRSCGAMLWQWNAGTGCIRQRRNACPIL